MRIASTLALLAALSAFGASSCSGGGDKGEASLSVKCIGGEAFCLIGCDLVCTQTGCAITEIAENQILRFVFSSAIAPSSVNGASVSLRTPSGIAADGELFVQDREMKFVPRVQTVGGVSTFGFLRNESYIITLADNDFGQGIRSTSGDGLEREFSCTVLVSQGIQDADQQPPTVELVSPTDPTQTPTSPTIVLRFSELIDTTALQGPVTASSPINFVLRGTTPQGGTLVCDSDQAGIALEGIAQTSSENVGGRDVTVYSFTPPLQLPGEHCLTCNVTADVRDLSGRSAVPSIIELITVPGVSQPITITETFSSSSKQDLDTSSSTWNAGARPGTIGENGRHGSFDPNIVAPISPGVFEWDVDSITIPASKSLTGLQYLVTDGKFYFTDFDLPAGTTLKFKGSVPPQIWVRGRAEIAGTIDVSGVDLPFWTPTGGLAIGQRVQDFNARGTITNNNFINGQTGGTAGVGGGRGGKGGDECKLDGDISLGGVHVYYGQPGVDVRLAAGHAYTAQAVGTGGKGSKLFPIAGTHVFFPSTECLGVIYRARFAPGGSGGGYAGPGGVASVTPLGVAPADAEFGPIETGGFALGSMSTLPSGFTSLNHFTIGGSGGGGGGSHMFGTQNAQVTVNVDCYMAGSAGSGGGGAIALRAGGNVTVADTAVLAAKGGAGVLITGDDKNTPTPDANWGVSSPGGGGSGGSVLVQSGGTIDFAGQLDVRGGAGSRTGSIQNTTIPSSTVINIQSQAGAGSPGWYRLEANGGSPTISGTGQPAFTPDNVGPLTDRDAVTGSASLWYTSNQVFPPQWLRYELDVDTDNDGIVDIVYTDSGEVGTQRANDPLGPVTIQFQGAMLTQGGEPQTGQIGPWRDGIGAGAGPGISLDSVTGFRFMMFFNGQTFPNCVVRALRVYAQT